MKYPESSSAFLKLLHLVPDPAGLVALGPGLGIAVEKNPHNPVGGSVAASVFQSSQQVGHQLVELLAFFKIGGGALVQLNRPSQVLPDIFRNCLFHTVKSQRSS